jgi:PPOX class probable F420-dependent enzyme
VFATIGDRIVTAIDDKPKTTTRLKRLEDVGADPRVALLADHYEEDWTALWWVRADGLAEVIEKGSGHRAALDQLAAKYEQYRTSKPSGPVIAVTVTRWSGWSAAG